MKAGKESAITFSERLKRLILPGFDGIPITQVITFVLKGFSVKLKVYINLGSKAAGILVVGIVIGIFVIVNVVSHNY
jgi:hypothetical protein